MILTQPLNIKWPSSPRGIIDIYPQSGKIIARKWPRKPTQPNSDAQLKIRDRFRSMNKMRKQLNSCEKSFWESMPLPADLSWDDIFRKELLKFLQTQETNSFFGRAQLICPVRWAVWSHPPQAPWNPAMPTLLWQGPSIDWMTKNVKVRIAAINDTPTFGWNNLGLQCNTGKRPKPHYAPQVSGREYAWTCAGDKEIHDPYFRTCHFLGLGNVFGWWAAIICGIHNYESPYIDRQSSYINLPPLSWAMPDFSL